MIFSLLFMYGCVTPVENINPNTISAVYHEHFKKCNPAEGSLRFSYTHQNQRLSFKSDWVSKDDKNWEIHFLDDIGRLQLGVKNDNSNIQVSGRAAQKAPEMEVDSNGRLLIKGYYSGFLAKELPCVLSGSLPSDWLYSLVATDKNKNFTTTFNTEDRTIQTQFIKSENTYGGEVCTQINWKVMGLVSQQSQWCFERKKELRSKITFQDHTLVWKSLRGS